MRRRRSIYYDNRLDWRDPAMSAYAFNSRTNEMVELSPERAQRISLYRMSNAAPTWRHDPTYNLRRRHRA